MDGRALDKRKARDKESDSEGSDGSLVKNPSKRARVDYPASSSPKEKSPSPGSAQKSPPDVGKSSLSDSFSAATPAPVKNKAKPEHNNGDSAMEGTSAVQQDNENAFPPMISKFDLPSPYTTQELEQKMGKSNELKDDDSDSDNGSTKFLQSFIKNEEKKKRQAKDKLSSSSDAGVEVHSNGTSTPASNMKRSTGTITSSKGNIVGGEMVGGKTTTVNQPVLTSSPVSDLVGDNPELEVTIKISDPRTHYVFLEETIFKSDTHRVETFLKQHNLNLPGPSHVPSYSSGYSADLSSNDNSASLQNSLKSSSSSSSNNRWTISSLGSTIPRQSIVSIATVTSESSDEIMKRPMKPALVSNARKRSGGPVLSSTKVEEDSLSSSGGSLQLDRMHVSANPLSNGDDDYSSPERSMTKGGGSPPKTVHKSKSNASSDSDSKIVGTSATPRKGILKGTPKNSSGTPGEQSVKKPAVRRRGGSANNFPVTNPQTPPSLSIVLSTPPPARSVAKIVGGLAKPQSRFEQELNNEPVIESELQKSETLWSTILPQELVFARWRDKNYYSGMVKSKGMNDTWVIDFDDDMEDVASETHIIPVRILGVGVVGIYSPDDHFGPKQATIIGQKFMMDPDEPERSVVKYAIKFDNDPTPIWCSRRQLSIKEADAKKLRPEVCSILSGKPGDVSIDNIVSGPRRRVREKPDKRIVGGAFDESSADDKLLESTPKSRGAPKGGRKTPATDPKRKRQASSSQSTATPQTKEPSTSTPLKESPGKESPSRKTSTIEPGKKKPKKSLFQGIQFFLTASGGGDPGSSGNPVTPPIPYDKDEYRELIEGSGGTILDSVGTEGKKDVFLISDSYARTVKYIYCLAAGIPCVSHTWVKQCLDNHEIVDWNLFTLPAGWSLENEDLIQSHQKKPLKGCKIFVTSESDQLYNYWKPVLTAAEATLLKPPKKKGTLIPTGTEVVVTDISESTRALVLEADANKIPVIKPEWLVQTIIKGEKAHIYGHDKYRILLSETEESEEFFEESNVGARDVSGKVESHD